MRTSYGSDSQNRGDHQRGGGNAPDAGARKTFHRRKSCRFCADLDIKINYKEPVVMLPFLNDRAKIIPRRISGNCATHQREMTTAIKRARQIALLPYTDLMGEA